MQWWWYFLVAFLIFIFVLFVFVFLKSISSKKLGEKEREYIKSHWIRLIDMFSAHPKEAIMDADKLLDYALKKHGFEGTLGEKLKKAKNRFRDLEGVWFAHKLRNKYAHEIGDGRRSEAKKGMKHFKKALNDLGAEL